MEKSQLRFTVRENSPGGRRHFLDPSLHALDLSLHIPKRLTEYGAPEGEGMESGIEVPALVHELSLPMRSHFTLHKKALVRKTCNPQLLS